MFNYFEFEPVNQILFIEIFSILAPAVFCSAGKNHMCNFGRGHYDEHLCKIIG